METDPCITLEHCVQAGPGRARLVTEPLKMCEVLRDVLGMTGHEHVVDTAKILVQSRPADTRPLGDEAHRHATDTMLARQHPGGLEDRRSDIAPVLGDRVLPEFRHGSTIRLVLHGDTMHIYVDTLSYKTRTE